MIRMLFYNDKTERAAGIRDYLERIRKERPVVQCITNIVTVNDCANALLAIGASPTMAHHPQEMEDFAALCDALVCNLGATESQESMVRAAALASAFDHPVVLDPVGCAGSRFRRQKATEILESGRITCIRGNAAEIRALAEHCNTGRGVDDPAGSATEAGAGKYAAVLARQTGAIVIASGKTDYISDGEDILAVEGGSPMLAKITGSGCMLSALLGAFLAVERSAKSAAVCCALMADCGEQAEKWTQEAGRGTGTFHLNLLDALSMF